MNYCKFYFLLLGFERSLVLQHEQVNSLVWKNNAQHEQNFCPNLYLNRTELVLDEDFNLMHNPLHDCANIFLIFQMYLKKSPNLFQTFSYQKSLDMFFPDLL